MNGLDPSSLCLVNSFSSSYFCVKFKLPAKDETRKPSPFKYGGKVIKSEAAVSPITSSSSRNNKDPYLHTLSRRRGLLFTATIPFLVGISESLDVNAAVTYQTLLEGLKKVVTKQKSAGLLRLVFHDAGTFDKSDNSGGMNGSIVYELDRPENAGLKKPVKVLEKAKSELDERDQVSWADMIAIAGAEAVSVCGGPVIPVQLGRVDSKVPDPEGKLPEESLDAFGLKQCFLGKGFSAQELVALSGAHTLGSKGFGNPVAFDNTYFKILLEKPWLSSAGMSNMVGLPSDRALPEDDECLRWIKIYADDQNTFFEDFKSAYTKLVNSGASWKTIRKS
ncbi:Ascorbate peroxidase [Thalictrum thalictroides]|uniref:L-ascorbate peroxidase n=1 Tax=Thalictrum thalictroides TaxID=46969 RepID=A0A7J6WBV8_THATH|nr:Ascorbate peroxidase [Thalictrum thalictroides]